MEVSVKNRNQFSHASLCLRTTNLLCAKDVRKNGEKMKTIKYGVTPKYLTINDKPWFPIMGEIHYSRFDHRYWKESLYKMKSGGVDVVSSYVLWIHHEEIEGEYDFTGNKNLREFVEAVKQCGLSMMLRIGPWCHAECRNGGFPDWILKKEFEVRSNDKEYFNAVEVFYKKIFEQVEGYLLKDDGPIIGVQIENEYGHCGGLVGEEGEEHMRTLAKIAKDVGFDVPYYTATGWGGAVTGGLLPVMGGYCEAPWDQRLTKIEPSGNYIFTHERNDHNIGSDYGFGTGITFDIDKFPFLTAELGGGLQVTKHRRPIAYSKDIGAMSMVKLGSGVNLLGYYMYHGGTNPIGKLTTLQETRESGYPNDLPILNYDFNAPLREYGQISETYKEIKLLTMFIKDFGKELCDMPAVIPNDNPLNQTDFIHLRTSYRHNGKKGYIFVNNYQKNYEMAEHKNTVLHVPLEDEVITYPETTVKDKDFFFYPFNMDLGEATLKTALATPLCKLNNDYLSYVFYADGDPSYHIDGKLDNTQIITITREEAKNAYKVWLEQEYLIISDSAIVAMEDGIHMIGNESPKMLVYPELSVIPEGYIVTGKKNQFTIYEKKIHEDESVIITRLLEETTDKTVYHIEVKIPDDQSERFMYIDYIGDTAQLYHENDLVADHFYTGQTWELSLKHLDFCKEYRLEIVPLKKETKVFLEQWPELSEDGEARVIDARIKKEYHEVLKFQS